MQAILMVEESETTIDDGSCSLWQNGTSAWPYCNLVAARHNRDELTATTAGTTNKADKEPVVPGYRGSVDMPNWRAKGNVAFVDDHVEYVDRKYSGVRVHTVGDLGDFVGSPDPVFK